jgi:hypothetical protein
MKIQNPLLIFLALTVPLMSKEAEPSAGAPEQSAPQVDRIQFPKNYAKTFTVLRTVPRLEKKEVITIYGNKQAASVTDPAQLPYPYGSIIVMEKSALKSDAEGKPVLDSENNPQKSEVLGMHVMRREPGFGVEYGENRTGEWEYVEYLPDGGYITPPAKSFSCAECHLKAGPEKDWVFHGRFSE